MGAAEAVAPGGEEVAASRLEQPREFWTCCLKITYPKNQPQVFVPRSEPTGAGEGVGAVWLEGCMAHSPPALRPPVPQGFLHA